MSRPAKILTVALVVVFFLAASLGLGRVLSARGAERTLLEQLITDQAKGDAGAVDAAVTGCAAKPACVARTKEMVGKVANPGGRIEVLQVTQGTDVSAGESTGVARIAWNPGKALPVVQCVATRRTGNVFGGFAVELLAVSKPIDRTGACPDAAKVVADAAAGR